MNFEIRFTDTFKRAAKVLAKKHPSLKQDIIELTAQLIKNPELGEPLGKNLYKVRMNITSKARGKSGGARVITCVVFKSKHVLLAEIYDKSDYATVDEGQIIKNLKSEGFDL